MESTNKVGIEQNQTMSIEQENSVALVNYHVTAVVVTFNRLSWLKKVIEQVSSQTYECGRIVVVDNCSTDGTAEWLTELANANPKIVVYTTPQNIGGAGGFAKGMEVALSLGTDFVWIMDDDCVPRNEALDKLVSSWVWFRNNRNWNPGFMCSLVKFQGTEEICEMNIPQPVWDYTRHLGISGFPGVLVEHCSFVSVLIHRDRIKEHGLPYADYFIWFDDVEYTKRLSKSYPGILVLDSIVEHHTPVNRGVNFSDVNMSNKWKFEYGARNEASYRYHTAGIGSWMDMSRRIMLQMHQGKVPWKCRGYIMKALINGLTFNPSVKKV